jgi:hypothetical protein
MRIGVKKVINLIREFHLEPEIGERKFNVLLELDKTSMNKSSIVDLFIDFALREKFTNWISLVLNNNKSYTTRPPSLTNDFSSNGESLYRKGFDQGFAHAMDLIKRNTCADDMVEEQNNLSEWRKSQFLETDNFFGPKNSETKLIRIKLKEYLES